MQNLKKPNAFGVLINDLEIILKNEFKLTCVGLSPLAGDAKAEGELSDEVKELLTDEEFKNVAKVLAQPSFKIPFYKGGGGQISERFTLYGLKNGEKISLVSLHAGEHSIILFSFENIESFAAWFANGYGSNATGQIANIIKPKVSPEELVCILHLVDCYKRVQMCTMLDYVVEAEPYISAIDYAITLKKAVENKDTRWLMPAFLEVTPGLAKKSLEIGREHLDAAISIDLIAEIRDKEESVYKFKAYGKVLGVEFDKEWAYGVGFNVVTNVVQGEGLFLCPTSMANHIFTLENGEISHNVYTQIGLAEFIYEMINNITI